MELTRRRFIPLLGAGLVGGLVGTAGAKSRQGREAARSPEQIWAELMEGNRRFVAGKPRARNLVQTRAALASGQEPQAIMLSCSDSRVVPNTLFDNGPGDLFVVRTAGNVADAVDLGSIEYGAAELHATLLVVLGHEKCGAVAAALSGKKMPTANLEAIVAKIAPAVEKVRGAAEGDRLLSLAVAANVEQSAKDVIANSPLLARQVADGKLTVIKAIYRLKSGEVVRLG